MLKISENPPILHPDYNSSGGTAKRSLGVFLIHPFTSKPPNVCEIFYWRSVSACFTMTYVDEKTDGFKVYLER